MHLLTYFQSGKAKIITFEFFEIHNKAIYSRIEFCVNKHIPFKKKRIFLLKSCDSSANVYCNIQRFQELEEEHICQMKDFVETFAKAWENEHVMLGQVRGGNGRT